MTGRLSTSLQRQSRLAASIRETPMNRFAVSVLVLALAACSPSGGGSGSEESRTYPLQDFESVSAAAGIEVIIKQGAFAVEARSRNGDLSQLAIESRGAELQISRKNTLTIGRSPAYTVTVTAPKWTAIAAAAGVQVDGENLQLEDVRVDGAAGVRITLSGTCRELKAEASAGAVIDAGDLKCAAVDATASAGARIEAYASEKARGDAAAGAVVRFSGNPPMVEKDAALGGMVEVK
jgi:hypothetical protein